MYISASTFVQRKFTLEGIDPIYAGYCIEGNYWNGWEQPCFTKEVAMLICEDFSQYLEDGEYYFKQDGDNFIYQGDKQDEPEILEPSIITCEGKQIVVYGFGCGLVWEEETSKEFWIEKQSQNVFNLRDENFNTVTNGPFKSEEEAETFCNRYGLKFNHYNPDLEPEFLY